MFFYLIADNLFQTGFYTRLVEQKKKKKKEQEGKKKKKTLGPTWMYTCIQFYLGFCCTIFWETFKQRLLIEGAPKVKKPGFFFFKQKKKEIVEIFQKNSILKR